MQYAFDLMAPENLSLVRDIDINMYYASYGKMYEKFRALIHDTPKY